MKKVVGMMIVTLISNFGFSQTIPEMINPVAHKLENTTYAGSQMSLETFIKGNKDQCTTRVAQQIQTLNKNRNFLDSLQKGIGVKLKKADSRCKYYRFEIIDFVKEDSSIAKLFTYRCYASKTATLPHQRASHLKPIEFNPASFYHDKEKMEKDCDALAIVNRMNKQTAESAVGNDKPEHKPSSSSTNRSSPSPSKSSKVSGQN
ncbi:MAG: hypothetical protein H7235_05015 [Bdellovibrionaceae bacterium]|nr:hypothetical protein [Pseudobdellovibrionaceae bacterium]